MGVSLKYLVEESDLVLVGIGEEWGFKLEYLNDPFVVKEIQDNKETASWLLPYIEYYYLNKINTDNRSENYKKLRNIIGEKEHFLISTVHDSLAIDAGFSVDRAVFPCGNFDYLQGIHNDTGRLYKIEDIPNFDSLMDQIEKLFAHEISIKDIVPIYLNDEQIIFNQKNIEIKGEIYNEQAYLENWQKYMDWLMTTMNRRLLILEFGVGMNYPTVIRFPFEKLTYVNNRARMIRVHNKLYQLTKEISEKSQGVQMNSIDFIMQESDG